MGARSKKNVLKPDILSINYGICTHTGQRQHNQDEVLVTSAPATLNGYGRLFAVADGMGGHPGGGLASPMACDCLNDFYERHLREKGKQKPTDIRRRIAEAIIRVDRTIRLQGLRDRRLEDMGTTLAEKTIAADAATELVHRALKGGARDNITAVVAKSHMVGNSCRNTKP